MMADQIRIVFDKPPGPEGAIFVEVEDEHGRSINVGEWVERPDGLWELRIGFCVEAEQDRLRVGVRLERRRAQVAEAREAAMRTAVREYLSTARSMGHSLSEVLASHGIDPVALKEGDQ